jgi:prevent-host-death family protein
MACSYNGHMTAVARKIERVGARELKTRLGKYLRAVRNGSIITVTERGLPVARLSPLGTEIGSDAIITELEAEGLLRRASGTMSSFRALVLPGESFAVTLDREREDRF